MSPRYYIFFLYVLTVRRVVHASSVISFQVYRRRNVFGAFGDKYIGELEQKLHSWVTHRTSFASCPILSQLNRARLL